MKRFRYFCVVLGLFMSCAQNTLKDSKLSVREHLYPANFHSELDNNLNFFRDGVGVHAEAKVPFDTISVFKGKVQPRDYVNTTEIGLYLNILTEVEKAGNEFAPSRIGEVLGVLETIETWNGLYFWPYDIVGGKLQTQEAGTVPAVDNANLAFALAGVAGAYLNSAQAEKQEIVARIEVLLQRQIPGWAALYDEQRGLLLAGWNAKDDKSLGYWIDRKANESRLAPLWAALITQNIGDTAEASQVPQSAFANMELYTQSYRFGGSEYEPMLTWDGAYFQAMLPAIWLNEQALIPDYRLIQDMTAIQMAYAASRNIPLVSSAATVEDGYAAFGVPWLSESKVKFGNRIAGGKTGTPHALALSYIVFPDVAVQALSALKACYPKIESEFGWYDAVDENGNMSSKILSLDQGMFVAAFLAEEINADVQTYIEARGYMEAVREMYRSFVPNNPKTEQQELDFSDAGATPKATERLWDGIALPD